MSTAPRVRKKDNKVLYAWLSLAFIPMAVTLADMVMRGMLSLLGVESGGLTSGNQALLKTLLVGLPFLVVLLLPGAAAYRFGARAARAGNRSGRLPSMLGIAWIVFVAAGLIGYLIVL